MNEVIQWLKNPQRKYLDGVRLFNQFKFDTKADNFFKETENPPVNDVHFVMLIRKMEYIARVRTSEMKAEEFREAQKPVVKKNIDLKPIRIPAKEEKNNIEKLRSNKLYINKVLTVDFSDLSDSDKEIFFNDPAYFNFKKQLLYENSKIDKTCTAIHGDMKNAKTDAKRKEKVNELISFDTKKRENWEKIDNWQYNAAYFKDKKHDPVKKAVEQTKKNMLKIGLLKNYIARAEKQLKEGKLTEKEVKKRKIKLENWKKELKQLESE